MPRRQHSGSDAFAVEASLVQTAGGGIQPGRNNISGRKHLAEAVRRVARLRVDLVITGDPLCTPVARLQQPHFKKGARSLTLRARLVPEPDAPLDALSALQPLAPIRDMRHPGRCHLPRVPHDLPFAACRDAVRRLPLPALAVPEQPWLYHINPDGIFQIFGL